MKLSIIDKIKNPITKLIIWDIVSTNNRKLAKVIQKALKNLGQNLEVDGDIGPITARAINSVNNKKLAREVLTILAGPKALPKNGKIPKWVEVAIGELGVKEIPGKAKSNPRVEQYHDAVGLPWAEDDVPWCGSFVGFCFLAAGYDIPETAARALSWLKFGVSAGKPVFGAVAVKKRRGGGHVTIVVGKDGPWLYCIGGNQHDMVCVSKYHESVFIDYRIPEDYTPTIPLRKWTGPANLAGSEA